MSEKNRLLTDEEREKQLIEEIEAQDCSDNCEYYKPTCMFIVDCLWWQQLKQKRGI